MAPYPKAISFEAKRKRMPRVIKPMVPMFDLHLLRTYYRCAALSILLHRLFWRIYDSMLSPDCVMCVLSRSQKNGNAPICWHRGITLPNGELDDRIDRSFRSPRSDTWRAALERRAVPPKPRLSLRILKLAKGQAVFFACELPQCSFFSSFSLPEGNIWTLGDAVQKTQRTFRWHIVLF